MYQIVLSKAVVGVDQPMKALSKNIQKPYKGKIVQVLIVAILSKLNLFEPNSFIHMFNVSTLYRHIQKPY